MTAIDERALEAAVLAAPGANTEDCRAIAEPIVRAYLQALRPGSTGETEGWRDIETAPKDGTEILLYGPGVLNSEGRTSMYARAQHVGWADEVEGHLTWYTRDPRVTCRPTHWRPLPEPPSAMLAAAGGTE